MTSTLHSDPVSTVLQRILTAERENDAAAFAALEAPAEILADPDAAARADKLEHIYMSVSEAGGELIYLLARASGARTVVEYGTSFGVSAIYLASAVRDNGGGTVITTELQPEKIAAATENFRAAGVGDLIELRAGDARETLTELPGPVDFVLLDGWPDLALDVLRVLEPALRPGTMILIDDVGVDFGRDVHGALLAYLADPANGYLSVELPVSDGIQAVVRL
ncbi:MAG: class I SAM-dependent methyltransferase [Nocardia sp.]|nr:class I SAM-dependent methyltransferase [Nocardia sp.]